MKRDMVKAAGAVVGAIALLAVLAGCGGKTSQPPASAAAAPSTPAAATPQPASPQPAAPQPAASQSGDKRLEQGKVIFLELAGGKGCQECHGLDGKGNTTVGGPDIRGKSADQVRSAMENVELMRKMNVSLSDEEVDAVVAYLAFLNKK